MTIAYDLKQRQVIERLLKKGLSYSAICRQIKRSVSGVSQEVRKNGGRDKYRAEEAQERAVLQQKSRPQRLPRVQLFQRMENLEMQLEIIIDQLKELRK